MNNLYNNREVSTFNLSRYKIVDNKDNILPEKISFSFFA